MMVQTQFQGNAFVNKENMMITKINIAKVYFLKFIFL